MQGLGIVASQLNAQEKMLEMLSNIEVYSAAHAAFNAPLNGASVASTSIIELIEQKAAK